VLFRVSDFPGKLGWYVVERELGRGGMGVVYLARDPKLDRPVAIKVLPEAVSENADRLARFSREAKIVARLNHPNIAAVYALHEHLGRQMLVMEYVEGVNLAERIDSGMALTVAEALQIGVQTAAGLEAAHDHGVVHRDLKPANVRLRRDGMVKVLDFGLAKPEAEAHGAGVDSDDTMSLAATEAGRVLGTAGYMSPEQARGKPVDKRTDIWAFGCVLYECLTSTRAFGGETAMDAMVAVLERHPAWERLPEDLPDSVRDLLRRCLEKDVERRARDIGDVRLQLEDALAGGGGAFGTGAPWGVSSVGSGGAVPSSPGRSSTMIRAGGSSIAPSGTAGLGWGSGLGSGSGSGSGVGSGGGLGSGSGGSGSGVAGLATPTNLKAQLTRFLGRGELLTELSGLLTERRLPTLTGAAGTGKTRLALEGAARRSAEHRGGVWIVELGALTSGDRVALEAANVLGVVIAEGVPAVDQLVAALSGQDALLILDNCEHLLDAAGELAARLLSSCPGVRILATGREALGLPGETVLPVPPMEVPGDEDAADPELLEANESVQLFLDRARAVRPRFCLTPGNTSPVVKICRELDGIPLAIELAAARVKLLSVEQIAERLSQRFKLLRGGGKQAPSRQQTLEAAIAWSYDQLEPGERAALRRLAVFGSGFTLGAAEAVCSGEYAEQATPGDLNADSVLEEWEVIDLLGQLIDKSLLIVAEGMSGALRDGPAEEPRYRMLETIRQFGLLQLQETGETREARDRLLSWMVSLTERAGAAMHGPEQAAWFARLRREHASIRGALDWVLEGEGDLERGRRLAAGVWRYWAYQGHMGEGRDLLMRLDAAGAGGEPTASWARVREAIGWTAMLLGDIGSAVAFGRTGLQMARAVGDELTVSNLLNCLGAACHGEGRTEEATDYFEQSLAIRRRLGELELAAACLNNLGECRRRTGDAAGARALYREAATAIGGGRAVLLRSTIEQNLSWIALERGEAAAAQEHAETALEVVTELGAEGELPGVLELCASIASANGEHAHAVTLFAAAERLREVHGSRPRPSTRRDFHPWLEASFETLGVAELSRSRAEGRAMNASAAVRAALGVAGGDPREA